MKFAANISTMFQDKEMCDRFEAASSSDFKAVELQFPYKEDLVQLYIKKKEASNVDLVLMNSPYEPGPVFPNTDFSSNPEVAAAMEYAIKTKNLLSIVHRSEEEMNFQDPPFGMACLPQNELEFYNSIICIGHILDLLKCRKLHVMAGIKPDSKFLTFDNMEDTYLRNIEYAISNLEEYQVQVLIEPLCEETKPRYFLNSFEQAVKYIKHFNNDNLKLLLDVYHLFKIEGNVEEGLKKYLPYAGHVQISQSPGRSDPFMNGDINYAKVMEIIKESSYDGYIGLEYTPADSANPDFTWMKKYTE